MIHPIPTIVVVDSEKTPEDQLRTMIILFRPTDADIIKYGGQSVSLFLSVYLGVELFVSH